jgi:hypothetical protein
MLPILYFGQTEKENRPARTAMKRLLAKRCFSSETELSTEDMLDGSATAVADTTATGHAKVRVWTQAELGHRCSRPNIFERRFPKIAADGVERCRTSGDVPVRKDGNEVIPCLTAIPRNIFPHRVSVSETIIRHDFHGVARPSLPSLDHIGEHMNVAFANE